MDIKDRVLVIEDDKSIRNFFRTVLEANNYDVLIATTGAEGYSMVTSQCPDVVILDLGLPDMDGMSILKNVRQWSSMPVLVVSAELTRRIRWQHWMQVQMIILRSPLVLPSCWRGCGQPSVMREPLF